MENDRPANIKQYNGTYSTHLFANKVKDVIRNHDIDKVNIIIVSITAGVKLDNYSIVSIMLYHLQYTCTFSISNFCVNIYC